MTDPESPQTADICLLLRAFCEQHWLIYELVPVVRQLESAACVPEEQLGAAFAYLEALSIEALQRAAHTERAFAALDADCPDADAAVLHSALRYHRAVRALRSSVARRVAQLVSACGQLPAIEAAGP